MKRVIVTISLLLLSAMLLVVSPRSQEEPGGTRDVQPLETQRWADRRFKLPNAIGPSKYILFTGKVKEKPSACDELEAFFRDEVMPMVADNRDVLGLETYTKIIGGDFKYVVLVEMKPDVSLSYSTLVEIFSKCKSCRDSLSMINRFASFFESTSTSVILYRPDLSFSPGHAGFYSGRKESPRRETKALSPR